MNLDFWHLNPVLVNGLVTALLVALIAFGVPITPDQKVSILGLVGAAWAIVSALIVRNKVTPNKSLQDVGLDPDKVSAEAKATREGVQP